VGEARVDLTRGCEPQGWRLAASLEENCLTCHKLQHDGLCWHCGDWAVGAIPSLFVCDRVKRITKESMKGA
jgi:hypothetical protein